MIEVEVLAELRAVGAPVGLTDLAHRMRKRYRRMVVQAALRRLRSKGWVDVVGPDYCAVWVAIRDGELTDARGKDPGALANLARGAKASAAARAAAIRQPTPEPVATTTLEQCWGWMISKKS